MNVYFLLSIIKLLLFDTYTSKEAKMKKHVLIPFYLEENNNEQEIYDSESFIKNYYHKNIILNFNLGEPGQKINGIISDSDLCFELKERKNISLLLNEKYTPNYSSSFLLFNKLLWSRWGKTEYMLVGYDYIFFENISEKYNISFMFQISEEKEINSNDIITKEYIAKIGLSIPTYYTSDECPNFISGIKSKAGLDKYTISFEFTSSSSGNFIIGDELYNYNPKKYFESQYLNTYSNEEFELFFNDIMISDNINNQNISFNGTYTYLSFNLRVIIGSKEYKQEIDNTFFNKLVLENICQIDNITFNTSQSYYIYNCDADKINLKLFPKLIFVSKDYQYNFEFSYSDLFTKINSRYYFLIIFKSNYIKNIKDIWVLGQTFYKRYAFTINLDARIIGFYNPNLPINEDDLIDDEKETNNTKKEQNNREENSSNVKKIIFIVLLIVIIVVLLIFAFILGTKMTKDKKKRANELKDDNYEYFPEENEEKNKDLHKIIN